MRRILVLGETPIGPVTLVTTEVGLRELRFGAPRGGEEPTEDTLPLEAPDSDLLWMAVRFVEGALDPRIGEDLPRPALDLRGGSAFRRRVWEALLEIPRGEVRTYGALSTALGVGSARAVGQAVGANPLPLVIPCHRVVGAVGQRLHLGGYSGGLERKVQLLGVEGVGPDRIDQRVRRT
jgi:O-6-methylguanine DNA methyltransferase